MVQGDRHLPQSEPFDPAGLSRPAAVARARALVTAGEWVGSYVLAGAILEETMRAVGAGRTRARRP